MSVKEYIKGRLIDAGVMSSQSREDKARFTVSISASLHQKLQNMADILCCSKTSLASDVLEVAIMEFDISYPIVASESDVFDSDDSDSDD